MPIPVSFADLTHTGKKIDATYVPYGVAGIASYLAKQFGDEVDIELFKYPHDFARHLDATTPVIAAFANYCWNEDIAVRHAAAIRARNPQTITVMGGPNYPFAADEQREFLVARPAIDFYVDGEGEHAFLELYKVLREADFDGEAVRRSGIVIPSTQYLNDGELVRGELLPRMTHLDDIPSPYLTGMMDKFFDEHLTPMVQTARGCPYSCTFCHDGLDYMNKYRRYSLDRVRAEIEYIKERRKTAMFCIVDDNFGISKEDEEVAKILAQARREVGWPNYINYGGTAKNNKDRIVRISEHLGNMIEAGASVQSTDASVLDSIRRSNISTETIASMAQEVAKNGSTSFTEIILCLPGDTKEKHMKSVYDMVDLGIQDFKLFQFVVLPGTEAATPHDREKYGYVTQWRVFPRCIGHYEACGTAFSSGEVSEVCVGNNSMPPEDYAECRKFDLTVGIFFNGGTFDELFRFLRLRGVAASAFLAGIFEYTRTRSPAMDDIFAWFEDNEAKSLFDTDDDLRRFLAEPGTIERYISGDLGINQMMHGRAMALSTHFTEVVELAFQLARDLLDESGQAGVDGDLYLSELEDLILARKGGIFDVRPPEDRVYHFDFVKMMESGFLDDPARHVRPEGVILRVDHSEGRKDDVRRFGEQFGQNIDGVSHFLQRSAVRNVYREVVYAPGNDIA